MTRWILLLTGLLLVPPAANAGRPANARSRTSQSLTSSSHPPSRPTQPSTKRSSLASSAPRLNVVEHRLKNGMKFLIVERHVAPTVAAFVLFKVGGVDDPAGQTGSAHLLEHMMFKGTRTLGTLDYAAERPLMAREDQLHDELQRIEYREQADPFYRPDPAQTARLKKEIGQVQAQEKRYVVENELDEAYDHLGGTGLNAMTGSDGTNYVIELPANALEAWAYAESDRIRSPVFREFYTERNVVHEERRMRTETEPEGMIEEALNSTAFVAHPYHNPVIGWPTDIDNTKREEVLAYFRTHYAPNNAVVAIVGDVNPAEVIRLAEKYFGPIPPQPQPFEPLTVEPAQRGERRTTVVFDASPQLSIAYHIPAIGNPDAPALEMLGDLLSSGRTSRFYTAITQKGLGQAAADGGTGPFPNLFGISGVPQEPTTAAGLERAILTEIDRVKSEPCSDRELQRLRNQLDAETVRELESNGGIASLLLDYESKAGDWRYYYKELALLKAVTPADLTRVARKYLTAENRTVVTLAPSAEASVASGKTADDAARPTVESGK